MAKKSFKGARKGLAAAEPPNEPAAAEPFDIPTRDDRPSEPSEPVVERTQTLKPPLEVAPAEEPPKLLTPLAAVWPKATLAELPESQKKAAAPKAPTPTATSAVKVSFVLFDPDAKRVALAGEFNGWASDAAPMKRNARGLWETTIALAPGRYEYKFVVDGQWRPDPQAQGGVWNPHGTLNSVVEVRA